MITFLDLVQKPGFRKYVEQRIANGTQNPKYTFSAKFPPLFKYCPLASYTIENIINKKCSVTTIGDFNDLFDGAIHSYSTEVELDNVAEAEWEELEKTRIAAKQPNMFFGHDLYTNCAKEKLREDSYIKFGLLNYLSTYVGCFSTTNDSTLMWAHYADCNKGICIKYDFNQWEEKSLLRNLLFPVSYSDTPINIADLFGNEPYSIFEYPVDAAVLCAALNKATIWEYEKEWRLVWVLAPMRHNEQRMPMRIAVNPSAIYFGNHFLKLFFYYDSKDEPEQEKCKKSIENIELLLNYMVSENIPAYVMIPRIGNYVQIPKLIQVSSLQKFISQHFRNHKGWKGENMRFYESIHLSLNRYLDGDGCHV